MYHKCDQRWVSLDSFQELISIMLIKCSSPQNNMKMPTLSQKTRLYLRNWRGFKIPTNENFKMSYFFLSNNSPTETFLNKPILIWNINITFIHSFNKYLFVGSLLCARMCSRHFKIFYLPSVLENCWLFFQIFSPFFFLSGNFIIMILWWLRFSYFFSVSLFLSVSLLDAFCNYLLYLIF